MDLQNASCFLWSNADPSFAKGQVQLQKGACISELCLYAMCQKQQRDFEFAAAGFSSTSTPWVSCTFSGFVDAVSASTAAASACAFSLVWSSTASTTGAALAVASSACCFATTSRASSILLLTSGDHALIEALNSSTVHLESAALISVAFVKSNASACFPVAGSSKVALAAGCSTCATVVLLPPQPILKESRNWREWFGGLHFLEKNA